MLEALNAAYPRTGFFGQVRNSRQLGHPIQHRFIDSVHPGSGLQSTKPFERRSKVISDPRRNSINRPNIQIWATARYLLFNCYKMEGGVGQLCVLC